MEFNFRKTVHLFNYYLIPFFMLAWVFFNVFRGGSVYDFIVLSGNAALILVTIALFIKPLQVLTKLTFLQKTLTYRREMGVLAFWFAVVHGVAMMFYLNLFSVGGIVQIATSFDFMFWGFLALLGMVLLGLTSNRIATMKLGRNWKRLQMIAYPTFALILVHKAEVSGDTFVYGILSAYVVLKIAEIYIIRKRKKAMFIKNQGLTES